jgi:hypothetical protein
MVSVLDLCKRLNDQKIGSKKFGEMLQVEGRPLWYFLDPFLLPRPFKSWREIDKNIKNRPPTRIENFKIALQSLFIRKNLIINEKIKFSILKKKKPVKHEKKDILFLGYTNQVFENNGKLDFFGFGDVLNAVQRKKLKPLVLVCDPISNPFFKIRKFANPPDYLFYPYEYIDKEILRESKIMAHDLHRKWRTTNKSKLFTFRRKNYWPFLKNEMNFVFSEEMLFITLALYMIFKKIINLHKVKVLYVTGWGIPELALLAAARKLGRKVIYSPHGMGGTTLHSKKDKYENVIFIAVGEEQKKELMRWGIRKENIVVTGSPFFDKIAEFKLKKKANELEKVITFLTDDVVESKFMDKKEYFSYVRRYLIHLSRIKNVKKIVIKLHPNEKYKSEYDSIVRSLGLKNVEIVQDAKKETLYSILRDSDLLINFGSTACVEGLMLDKDAILIGGILGDYCRIAPYREAVILMDKDDDLTSVVDKVLNNKKLKVMLKRRREEYLRKSFYRIDGKAHERVADLIFSLIMTGGV